jgi:streptogramin lyase
MIVMFAFFASMASIAVSAAPPIIEYAVPTANAGPQGIVAGPDGNLWFTEFNGNKIGRITTEGVITEFPIPTPNSGPRGITAGPDGNLWFTETSGNKIGKITVAGAITEYAVPTANATPYGIVTGPDQNLWFTEHTAPATPFQMYKIGKITVSGTVTEYSYNAVNFGFCSAPTEITARADGLWFGGSCAIFINMTTAGSAVFGLGINGAIDNDVYGITLGADGNFWATLYSISNPLSRIAKLIPSDTLYTISQASAWPYGITSGPDGKLWFTEANANQVGTITLAGAITEYAVPTLNSVPRGVTTGPDGNVWFVEFAGNKIGKIQLVTPLPAAVPALSWSAMLALVSILLGWGLVRLRVSRKARRLW